MEGFGFMEKVTFEDSKKRLVQMDSVWICEKGLFFGLCKTIR